MMWGGDKKIAAGGDWGKSEEGVNLGEEGGGGGVLDCGEGEVGDGVGIGPLCLNAGFDLGGGERAAATYAPQAHVVWSCDVPDVGDVGYQRGALVEDGCFYEVARSGVAVNPVEEVVDEAPVDDVVEPGEGQRVGKYGL